VKSEQTFSESNVHLSLSTYILIRAAATSTNFCNETVSSAFSTIGFWADAGSVFCFSDQDFNIVSND